jgi:hypothetical protein
MNIIAGSLLVKIIDGVRELYFEQESGQSCALLVVELDGMTQVGEEQKRHE